MNLRYLNTVATFFLICMIVYVLFIGKNLFLPLIIALIFWYIIIRLTALYQKMKFGRRHLSYEIALILALLTTGVVLYVLLALLTYSIANIISAVPVYQQKLQQLLTYLDKLFVGKLKLHQWVSQINLSAIVSKLALIFSMAASNFIVILVYILFLLLEHRTFNIKLKSMCHSNTQYLKINSLLDKIARDINDYLKIKTTINLIAGILSSIVLFIFGIKYAEFWGMLFFVAHYIPYVGPIAAVVLVLIAASVKISQAAPLIILGSLLVVIQFGIGNFLEPRWLGTRLNLSPIVILISLAFWATLWGVVGMILCIPIMVIVNIVLSKFPKTRPIAVVLSADGKVDTKA